MNIKQEPKRKYFLYKLISCVKGVYSNSMKGYLNSIKVIVLTV